MNFQNNPSLFFSKLKYYLKDKGVDRVLQDVSSSTSSPIDTLVTIFSPFLEQYEKENYRPLQKLENYPVLLQSCFHFLEGKELIKVSKCSKKWNILVQDPFTWKYTSSYLYLKISALNKLKNNPKKHYPVSCIKFYETSYDEKQIKSPSYPLEVMNILTKCSAYLNSLVLYDTTTPLYYSLLKIKSLKKLKSLTINSRQDYSQREVLPPWRLKPLLTHLPNLKQLSLHKVQLESLKSLLDNSSSSSSLETLEIEGILIRDKDYSPLFLMPNLKHLILSMVYLENVSLSSSSSSSFSQISNLTSLQMDIYFLKMLSSFQFPCLEQLFLDVDTHYEENFYNNFSLEENKEFNKVKDLTLRVRSDTDLVLSQEFLSSFQSLTKLKLEMYMNDKIYAQNITRCLIEKNFSSLLDLELDGNCISLSSIYKCSHLKRLKIFHTGTELKEIELIPTSFPYLKELILCHTNCLHGKLSLLWPLLERREEKVLNYIEFAYFSITPEEQEEWKVKDTRKITKFKSPKIEKQKLFVEFFI